MQFQTVLLITLTVLLTACGKPESLKAISPKKQRITEEQMALIAGSQTITCSDGNFCPEGIARMFAINFEDANNSTTCTAFLVAPDVVITNSHCIHSAKKTNMNKICAGLYFVFPGTSGMTYTAQCSKILWRANLRQGDKYYSQGDNDFALIRLNSSLPLTPLKLLKGGLKPGTKVFPVVVDQLGGFNSRITKLECQVARLMPKYGVATLANCPVISGNSGAPVMDENHNVVGIIFASSNNKIRSAHDEITFRVQSKTKGYAFSMDYVQKVIGHLLY